VRAKRRSFTRHFDYAKANLFRSEEATVARKTVLVCDQCGKEVEDGKGAVVRLTWHDARRGSKQADLCDDCGSKLPGIAVARRGRKPKTADTTPA
jgi:hypothetical protein